MSNPQNVPYSFPVLLSKADSDSFLVRAFLKNPLGVWALEHHKTGRLVGMIRLEKIDPVAKWAEVSYFTHRAVWGQGFATEALKSLAFLAFHDLGLKTLRLITHEDNKRSQAVADQAGFKLVRRFKGSDRCSKQTKSYLEFELRKGDYRYE